MSAKSETLVIATTTVLVVDDDPITRKLLKRFLEYHGHSVLTAADGEQAWALFTANRPRLVITDWRMPRLDGFGLCKRIRQHEEARFTYILILTSSSDADAMEHGVAAGADDFMVKPFDRAELRWRIHSGLRVIGLYANLEDRIRQVDEARRAVEQANQRMREGLDAAAKTQRSLLPAVCPEVDGVVTAWHYSPSEHLGGDSLNVFRLNDHSVGFFIADVCGHGLTSALLAVSLHRVLTPGMDQSGLLPFELFGDPGKVLTEVNRRFPLKIEEGEYFTAVYGVIDVAASELRYAGAGHPGPMIMSECGQIKLLNTDGFPVGFDADEVYETQRIELEPGDRFCAITDGVVETTNPKGEMYGRDQLAKVLSDHRVLGLKKMLDKVVDSVRMWSNDDSQQDDISVVVFEFDPKSQPCERQTSGSSGASVT